MATADLSFDMRIKGTPEEVASILNIMFEYNEGKNGAYFSCTRITIGDQSFSLNLTNKDELIAAVNSNSGTAEISALGPFGKYGEIDDVDILRDMAKAAPNAYFTASITGFAGYADQSLSAELANGKMHVSTFYLSDDARGEAQSDYFKNYLPYEKFIELFKLDSEQFDEESFEGFILDVTCDYDSVGEYFEEIDFDRFIEDLSNYEAECFLSEEEYEEVAQQFITMDCISFEKFLENEDYTQCDEYTFDPADENSSGNGNMKMVPGVAYSINDDIRAYLDSIGHPSDDETINNLSVEDVYAILAGTYGKDTSAEDAECGSDEDDDSDEESDTEDCTEEDTEETDSDSDDDDESEDDESDDDEESTEYEDDSDDEEESEEEVCEDAVSEPVIAAESEIEKAEAEDEVEVEAETETETTTEAETETKEKTDSPKRKKSFPVWLIVLLAAVILIGVAAYVTGSGEKIFNYIADLLNSAARLL